MVEEIHSPLRDYAATYRDRFVAVAERTFDEYAKDANVDVAANRETCASIRRLEAQLEVARRRLSRWRALNIALWVLAFASLGLYVFEVTGIAIPLCIIAVLGVAIYGVYRKTSALKSAIAQMEVALGDLVAEAYRQMEPLNSLYDDGVFARMVHEVIPIVTLEPYLTTDDMRIFTEDMGLQYYNNYDSAILSLQSGKINGNPFLIARKLRHVMGQRTYTGTKTVSVRRMRFVNGKMQSYTTSEVLTASLTKPCPEYSDVTELFYGNQAAPELRFSRQKNHSAKKEGSLSYRYTRWKLKRKAADMSQDFAMMTNEEFEVLFNTADRTSNQQYALLFTPVAQANMIDLIRDEESTGFGDDFCFYKDGRINTIIADHLQDYNLDWTADRFRQYEYDKAKEVFVSTSLEGFHGLYFALAPLLAIPLYQQMRPGDDVRQHRPLLPLSHKLQHEAIAYYWGEGYFRNPQSVTPNILKTEAVYGGEGGMTTVNVTALGYRVERRTTLVTVRASDGRCHQVPVHWDEYIPVQGGGQFQVKEMADINQEGATPRTRRDQWSDRLRALPGFHMFRRMATRIITNNR